MNVNWDTQRVARTVLIVAIVLLSVWTLWHFLPALAWAGVLAIATWPLRRALAQNGMRSTGVACLLTLVFAVALIVPLIWLGVQAGHEGHAFMKWLEGHEGGLGTPDWLPSIPYIGNSVATWWQANLAERDAGQALLGFIQTTWIVNLTRSLGVQVANRLTTLIFAVLALFFLYRDGPSVVAQAHAIAERLFGPPGGRMGKDAVAAVRSTVNGLLLVGLAEGLVLGIAYALAGLHHVVLLGLVTGVVATVPFGAPLIVIGCALYLLATAKTTAAIALVGFGMAVVLAADHLVQPLFIGSATRLPFVWVLLGIFGGLETFGLVGLFLGPAIISILLAIWRENAPEPAA